MSKLSLEALNFLQSVMKGVNFNGFDEGIGKLGSAAQEVGDFIRAGLAEQEAPRPPQRRNKKTGN